MFTLYATSLTHSIFEPLLIEASRSRSPMLALEPTSRSYASTFHVVHGTQNLSGEVWQVDFYVAKGY
ncbi:hypothetical protein HBH79_010410 [Parastagonospora nodorum]|nr:hypothetical protein HBI01_010390 [Parastagonospora nodorum]KAH4474025.1 hypothetical protein HBH90_022190 [Parastagonospora nodorum]KAH4531966.1 hypothetical protein HBH87_033140 [Parastagonospora nodorum]KAH4649147.1 hypothetical protein HBH80_234900 [Parastagonospora nodorum]KAH4714232.1 hypothetical protein HBH79_010410 [Parastagonospora nodorum]